jgi:pyruvate/2-oxoglutarate/acetoin dehydrogenase E1 component
VEALNRALHDALDEDDRVMLLGEDVGRTGGVFRVSAGLLDRFGDERVVDMPIAESGTVGAAVGLCLAGFRPIVELQFDAFVYPAFEQVVTHVARYRWRTDGAAGMPMVVRIPFGGGIHAPELHSESPEALFVHLPGLKVVCPSTPEDAYAMLRWAVQDPDPIIFMEPKRLYRSLRGPCTAAGPADAPHTLRIARMGGAATVVTYGSMVPVCLEAAAQLEGQGIDVEVVDLRSLYPLDEDGLIKAVTQTGRCVIVHEAPRTAGLGAEVAALVAERALLSLQAPIVRVTGLDAPFPLYVHEHDYLPSADRVVTAVQRVMEF